MVQHILASCKQSPTASAVNGGYRGVSCRPERPAAAARPKGARRFQRRACSARPDGSEGTTQPQEKFLDTRSIVLQARDKSDNFVFEYDENDDDEPAGPPSLFEERMAAQAAAGALDQSGSRGDAPAAAEVVDVLSAYSPEQGFREVTVEAVAALRGEPESGPFLIDVRTAEEFDAVHAAGAVNVPLDRLTDAVKAGRLPGKATPVAVICQSGRRSAQAAVKLARVHGYSDVVNVQGGTLSWIAAGLPTEAGA